MSNRLIKCRKCEKSLSLAHYSINYNTGSLYSHCDDCKTNKKKPITTPAVTRVDNNTVEVKIIDKIDEVKEAVKVEVKGNNPLETITRINNAEELKAIFIDYGFKEHCMFIAKQPGAFFEAFINIKEDHF